METHFDLTDPEFEKSFAECTLSPAIFSHEAHLRLAWIHIDKNGIEQAKVNIQNQIKDFVAHVGAKDKYHHTLTITAIHAVHHFMNKSESNNFIDFISEFPQLKGNFKKLIASHYSFDIFESAAARNEFVEPDLLPFE